MIRSVLKLTKPVTKITRSAASCNYLRCYSILLQNELASNKNQQLVRYFAKESKIKQSKKESKNKEKSLKSEVKADQPITKTSDLAKKKDGNTDNKIKLSKKEEYERSIAVKKAKEKELAKENSKTEVQEEDNKPKVKQEVEKVDISKINLNEDNEKEFIPDVNSWSKKILSANSLKPAIRILEEHQNEFPLNEIPYIIKTFGVYFSSVQSKFGLADIRKVTEFKTFSDFLDKYYENNFKENTTKYPISPTQMVDVLITLNRMSYTNHPLYKLFFNNIKTVIKSLTPSHLSKLLWLYSSNRNVNYQILLPIIRTLNEHLSELSEENLCRTLWSISHLPYKYHDLQTGLEDGLNCLVKLNEIKPIELNKLLSMLPEIPNRNTNSCKYFNVLFHILIPYNGTLSYSDAVTILHAYVNHSDDISFSTVRKNDDILHKPTPELQNLLDQSFVLASEHINEFNKSQLVEFSFYINHCKAPIQDHIMANALKRTSELIKEYGPAASLIALDLFGTHTKELVLDNLGVYSSILEQVKSHFANMSESQLNITIELFSVLHNMLREEDKILPTLLPVLYKIITKPNNNNNPYSTRLIGTYLRAVKNMGINKPTSEEMNQLLSQFVDQMSLDKTPGNDIMLILSFSYVENKELVIRILKFIETHYNEYTLNPLTAVSLLETCVKYDYTSADIYKLCLACFLCEPEVVQLEEFTSFCRCALKMNITSNSFKKLLPILEKSISSFKATSLVDILTYISTMNFSYPQLFNISKEKILRDKRCLKNSFNILYSYYRQNVDEVVFKDLYNHFFNSIKPEELSETDKNFYDNVLCEMYK